MKGRGSMMRTTVGSKAYTWTYSQLSRKIAFPERIWWTVKTFGSYKSSGPDGIYPFLGHRAEEKIMGPLARLIRASLTLGNVLEAAWVTIVIFIPKARRGSFEFPKDFRTKA